MARTVRIANSGSVIASPGASVIGSKNSDVQLGFATPITSSGCVTFYHTNSLVPGFEICSIALSPGGFAVLPNPINSPSGIFIGASGGSPFAWILVNDTN